MTKRTIHKPPDYILQQDDDNEFPLQFDFIEDSERVYIKGNHAAVAYLVQDDAPSDGPREDQDNLGTMACWHPHYNLGDKEPKESKCDSRQYVIDLSGLDEDNEEFDKLSAAEFRKKVWEEVYKKYIILPLILYDHSGITIRVGRMGDYPFDSAGWDTSEVGWIFVSKEKAKDEFKDSLDWEKKAENLLLSEVETYDQYLTGEVYGVVVEIFSRESADGPWIQDSEDSCWGFYGLEYAERERNSWLSNAIKEIQKEGSDNGAGDSKRGSQTLESMVP